MQLLIFLLFFLIQTSSLTYEGETNSPSIHSTEDLSGLINHIGAKQLVLLGEASHGTSEFYTERARISRKLIASGKYAFVAVEGDWPQFTRLNAFVKHHPDAPETLDEAMNELDRWPLWMWRNEEFREFVLWLHEYNASVDENERVGLYGVDLYAKKRAISDVTNWLREFYPDEARVAENAYRCQLRFSDIRQYLQRVASTGDHCGEENARVVELISRLKANTDAQNTYPYFRARHNAYLVEQAELHYRGNLMQGPASWNARASFFFSTAHQLLNLYATNERQTGGIIWAHNTHIGDARATDMINAGMINIGQLAREELGQQQVFSVGFGTYEGTVLAASGWEAPVQVMPVAPARRDSWEYKLASLYPADFYVLFHDVDLGQTTIPHRAIGVTFNPQQAERQNFPLSIPAERYDAFVFIRETSALEALDK